MIVRINMANHKKTVNKICAEFKSQLQDLVIDYDYRAHQDEPCDILLNAAQRIANIASTASLKYLNEDIIDK